MTTTRWPREWTTSARAVAGAIVIALWASTTACLEIPLSLQWPEGTPPGVWPVELGVPLPSGAVREVPALVLEAEGETYPVQVAGVARWPDDSWRWLRVTALAPARRGSGPVQARLRAGTAAAPELRVSEQGSAVEVLAGGVRFRVGGPKNRLLEALSAGGKALWGPMRWTMALDGRTMQAGGPIRVRVTESGPLRATVIAHGAYGPEVRWELRMRFYAGVPGVRVWHRFIYTGRKDFAELSLLRMELPVPRALGKPTVCGEASGGGQASLRVAQIDESTLLVGNMRRKQRAIGKAEVGLAPGASLSVAVPWFWQQYPQAMEWVSGSIRYDAWAPEGGRALVGIGAAKTHEIVIWSGPGAAPPLAEWPIAVVDPAWIAGTRALPYLPDPASPSAAPFVGRLERAFSRYVERNATERWDEAGHVACPDDRTPGPAEEGERPRTGAFGMWNWGDWNFRGYHDRVKGCDAWGNLEYDTPLVLALAFAATGNPEIGRMAAVAARHFADVDIIHAHPRHPEWVGMNHPKNPRHFTFALGTVDLGHTWAEGLFTWWYLTGDEHGAEAGQGIAEYLVRRIDSGIIGGNPRRWGWPVIALIAAWEATGRERYLDAAVSYARRGMAAHPPSPERGWKTGILADALVRLYRVRQQPEIGRWLERYARAVLTRRAKDPRFYPAVAWLATERGDREAGKAAREVVARMRVGHWGKPFTIGGRYGLRILGLLDPPRDSRPGKALDSTSSAHSRNRVTCRGRS